MLVACLMQYGWTAPFYATDANNPLMDIRIRERANLCVGDSSLLDLAFNVRTSDGSGCSPQQILEAVQFSALMHGQIVRVRALRCGFSEADHQNDFVWTQTKNVLEFRSAHYEGRSWTTKAGATLNDRYSAVVFRVTYTAVEESLTDILWRTSAPAYNVTALETPGPGIETIPRLELDKINDLPIQCAADIIMEFLLVKSWCYQEQSPILALIVADNGGSDAVAVNIAESLTAPANTYLSPSTTSGSYDGSTHAWTIPSMK